MYSSVKCCEGLESDCSTSHHTLRIWLCLLVLSCVFIFGRHLIIVHVLDCVFILFVLLVVVIVVVVPKPSFCFVLPHPTPPQHGDPRSTPTSKPGGGGSVAPNPPGSSGVKPPGVVGGPGGGGPSPHFPPSPYLAAGPRPDLPPQAPPPRPDLPPSAAFPPGHAPGYLRPAVSLSTSPCTHLSPLFHPFFSVATPYPSLSYILELQHFGMLSQLQFSDAYQFSSVIQRHSNFPHHVKVPT